MSIETSIIVLSFNKPKHLIRTIDSIMKYLLIPEKRELILVDNKSENQDVILMLNKFKNEFDQDNITVIRNPANLLFSAGMNVGIIRSKGKFVLLCNDDIEFTSDALSPMVNYLVDNPEVGTVTPVTVHSDGRVYCSGAYASGKHKMDRITEPRETEWNNMAVFLTRKAYFDKIGLLATHDPFQHYHSDEEWCRRVTTILKLKHVVYPAEVFHYYREKL